MKEAVLVLLGLAAGLLARPLVRWLPRFGRRSLVDELRQFFAANTPIQGRDP
jgi:hypothetical protein